MDKEMRRKDDALLRDLERRFDRHLEIYAKNGHELARLAEAVENLTISFNNHVAASVEYERGMRPLIEWFSNINFFKSAIMWIFGFIIALGGTYAVIKGFFIK